MIWRVEIKQKSGLLDSAGAAVLKDIADLGISTVNSVRLVSVYLLEGTINREDIKCICEQLLVDPIVEEYGFSLSAPQSSSDHHIIEIAYNPGVIDKSLQPFPNVGPPTIAPFKKRLLSGELYFT